jgi:hypothetical protein
LLQSTAAGDGNSLFKQLTAHDPPEHATLAPFDVVTLLGPKKGAHGRLVQMADAISDPSQTLTLVGVVQADTPSHAFRFTDGTLFALLHVKVQFTASQA